MSETPSIHELESGGAALVLRRTGSTAASRELPRPVGHVENRRCMLLLSAITLRASIAPQPEASEQAAWCNVR